MNGTIVAPQRQKRQYSLLAKFYHSFLAQVMRTEIPRSGAPTRWDFGQRYKGEPHFYTTKRQYDAWRMGDLQYPPRDLSKPILQTHLDGINKLYVTCGANADVMMLMLDVDAHRGEPDAPQLAMWAKSFFPGLYHEPSKRGWHGYVMVNAKGMPAIERRDMLNTLHEAMSAAAGEFKATMEVKGRPTIFGGGGQIVTRGGLYAIPQLPFGDESLKALVSSPVFSVNHLQQVCCTLLDRPAGKLAMNGRDARCPEEEKKKINSIRTKCTADWVNECDSYAAKRRACLELSQLLRRLATIDELLSYYGRHRGGQTDAKRRRDVAKVLAHWTQQFNPAAVQPTSSYLSRRHDLERVCEPLATREISAAFLAVVLWGFESNSFGPQKGPCEQLTWGTKVAIELIRKLQSDDSYAGAIPNRNRYIAARTVLEQAGLIVRLCGEWYHPTPGQSLGKGICRQWHVGPAHPRYAEFGRYFATLNVSTLTKRRARHQKVTAATAA